MREELAKELEKIGLSENEAKVYLAGLALGPSTAQMIAAKATVSRPTTYIMIESLIKRGLMSSFQKGKKTIFSSAAPNQILYIISAQQQALTEQEKRLKKIIHDLNQATLGNDAINPDINVYEGIDGLRAFQEDILASDSKEILELTSIEQVRKFLPPMFPGDKREEIGKRFKIKSLFTSSDELPKELSSGTDSKQLDAQKFDIVGEVTIYDDKVALTSYGSKLVNITIKNSNIARTVRTMFMALWNAK